MTVTYHHADDIEKQAREVISKLGMKHIQSGKILCLRSHGSKSKKSFARTYKLSEAQRTELGAKLQYVLEVISENFDPLSKAAKIKTLIHELLHIPKTARDNFNGHKQVSRAEVEKLYKHMRT
jgi:predicted metallopeptidase